jgi:excisionase family DNA binding protein
MKRRDNTMPSQLMRVEELVEYLKVSPRTIYRLLRNGHLPLRRDGSGFHFDRSEINRWIAEQQIKS